VLGQPADPESVFQSTGLEAFAAEIESETEAKTCIV
jgi:hypothetical protein